MSDFEKASKQKIRFKSGNTGALHSIEDLWDLPLDSRRTDKATLQDITKRLSTMIRDQEDDYVGSGKRSSKLDLAMRIILHIIGVRKEDVQKAKDAAPLLERRKKMLDRLADIENDDINNMSKEDILAAL